MAATISLSNNTVAESFYAYAHVVGLLNVSGGLDGETFTYNLQNFKDIFRIEKNSAGQYELIAKADKLDFENPALNNFQVSIVATGNKGTSINATPLAVTVTDANDRPTGITMTSGGSVAVNAAVGTPVAVFAAVDQDAGDTHTFSIWNPDYHSQIDDPYFKIENNKLVLKAPLSAAQAGTYDIWIEAYDRGGEPDISKITLTITNGSTEPSTPPPSGEPASRFVGTAGSDTLSGTDGRDSLSGLAGNDRLFGHAGDDVISGGAGRDTLSGGAGKDYFSISTLKKRDFDFITDFNSADDSLQFYFEQPFFKVKAAKGDLLPWAQKGVKPGAKKTVHVSKVFAEDKLKKKFFSVNKQKDANDFIHYDKKKGILYFDMDGSGKGKGFEILKLKPGTALSADDLWVA